MTKITVRSAFLKVSAARRKDSHSLGAVVSTSIPGRVRNLPWEMIEQNFCSKVRLS